MLQRRPWFKPTEWDRVASEETMSRIHEALNRAAQERSTQLAVGLEAQVAEVAGEIRRSVTGAYNVAGPAAPSRVVAAGSQPAPAAYEELCMQRTHPEWRLDALQPQFHNPQLRRAIASRS